MLDFAILAGLAAAGFFDQPGWWVLPGTAAMMLVGWWRKMRLLRQHPQVPLSSKMTTYLIVSIGINLGFATASLMAGRAARYLLGG